MTFKIRPLHELLVVRQLNSEKRTAGGIVIPETASDHEIARIRKSDSFYLNVLNSIRARG